jgi:hypothetical protein
MGPALVAALVRGKAVQWIAQMMRHLAFQDAFDKAFLEMVDLAFYR